MKNTKNLGFDVRIKFKPNSPFKNKEEVRHNVTEIHYNFDSLFGLSKQVALESDIHNTGGNLRVEWIEEFEAKLATEIAENY